MAALVMIDARRAESREELERQVADERNARLAEQHAREQNERTAQRAAAEKAAVEHQAAINQRKQQDALNALHVLAQNVCSVVFSQCSQ